MKNYRYCGYLEVQTTTKPDDMLDKSKTATDAILDRIKESKNLKTDVQLCEYLEVPQTTLSMYRKRDSFKIRQFLNKLSDFNMNYLLFGDEPVWRQKVKKNMEGRIVELDIPAEKKIDLLDAYIEVLEQTETKD